MGRACTRSDIPRLHLSIRLKREHAGCAAQTNMFQIQLITHLQCQAVPASVVENIRDLTAALEAATLEDLYVFFDALKLSEADIFTCIGTSGPEVCLLQLLPPWCAVQFGCLMQASATAARGMGQHDF